MVTLHTYGRILRRGWWLILLVLLIALGVGLVVTRRQPRVFQASTLVAVIPSPGVEGVGDVIRSLDTLERRSVIATFARVPGTREARNAAAELLGLAPEALQAYSAAANVLPGTNIIRIEVNGPEPRRAADLANAVAQVTEAKARAMYRVFSLDRIAAASPSTRPVQPNPRRNMLVAAIVGFFAGLAGAFLIEVLRAPDRAAAPGARP